MIEANSLQKHFGRVTAVRDVSLRAADGRITGLLGPNGAGKSTTLRILYTVIAPEAGDALIDGVSVVSQPLEARRRMGVLPHNAGIYPHLSARENIAYFGALHGLARKERAARTVELISLLEMDEFADRTAKGFSQGQRVQDRSRAGPHPSTAEYPVGRAYQWVGRDGCAEFASLLARLRDEGHCVLFSSHVMQEVGALCDDVVVIAHGTVVASGTPEELRARTGESTLEDAFVRLIGTGEGLS